MTLALRRRGDGTGPALDEVLASLVERADAAIVQLDLKTP